METKVKRSNDMSTTIDLGEVFRSLWDSFPILILTAIIGALIAYLISSTLITPEYSSTTKLYVMANEQQEKNDTAVDNGALQAGALLTKDYEQIIESREVTESVISNLNLRDSNGSQMTNGELIGKMEVSIPDETRVVNITVKDEDPYRACDIANAVREVSENRIQSIMDMKTVKTVSAANVPMNPDSPNKGRNAVIGGLVGLLLAMAVVILQNLSDNTIRSREDVQNYLGVSLLASIPLAEGEKKEKKHIHGKMKNAGRG